MGSCFSSAAYKNYGDAMPTAKIVLMDGSLREFSTPLPVSQVLGIDGLSCFLCNTDSLTYDDYVRGLPPSELVVPGNLYFMLPVDMLNHVLSGPDMAALAVKASSALANVITSKSKKGRVRIMPYDDEAAHNDINNVCTEFGLGSKGLRKTGKSAPLPARRIRQPFEVKLGTIEEVDDEY